MDSTFQELRLSRKLGKWLDSATRHGKSTMEMDGKL